MDNPKSKTQLIEADNGQIGISLSADTVAANMDRLVEDGIIAPGDKALMMWFFAELKDKTLTLADAGKAIGYDAVIYSGTINPPPLVRAHGWVEIEFDGEPYIFDPEYEYKSYGLRQMFKADEKVRGQYGYTKADPDK